MKIGIVNNCLRGETRVAASPETVKKMIENGHEVSVEHGLGEASGFDDLLYQSAGAKLQSRDVVLNAGIILSVVPPKKADLHFFKSGQWLICDLSGFDDKADMQDLVLTDIGVIDLGKMPRISRAQPMDILSSQSLIAGYKAATDALSLLKKTAPLLMTSAGTLFPAKACVVGAGVAGLSAVSVLKRAGSNVIASDIRSESKAEVESLGGKFVQDIALELKGADILITSAFSSNKKPPLLIKKEQIDEMAQNAVVIDMAQGNVEENFKRKDIVFIKDKYFARKLAKCASELFSNNVYAFLKAFDYLQKIPQDDEILRSTLICSDGFLIKAIK